MLWLGLADGQQIQEELMKTTNQRTVPNIFIHGKHVGGSDDLKKLQDSNKLAGMIGKA